MADIIDLFSRKRDEVKGSLSTAVREVTLENLAELDRHSGAPDDGLPKRLAERLAATVKQHYDEITVSKLPIFRIDDKPELAERVNSSIRDAAKAAVLSVRMLAVQDLYALYVEIHRLERRESVD